VTLTYWANENTAWNVTGIISSAINPFFVVTLTFPLIWFWRWLNRYGLEPSTPTKMAIGMVLTGCAFLIMYAAALVGEEGTPALYEQAWAASEASDDSFPVEWNEIRYQYRLSPLWLIGAYFVLTVAELMLSPMGLALVAKVSPTKYLGIMMGGWFVATAIGNKLTMIGVLWDRWLHSEFFLLLAGMALVVAVLLFFLLRPLKKAMPGV
jgi:POT family proton-dependent oligopeptide transporter